MKRLTQLALTAAVMCVLSVALYYVLPSPERGVTHFCEDGADECERPAWVRLAAPFYELGVAIVRHSPLPYKRIR